ncbi:MAG TPA: carboxypeptidase-like regulatory domain-containing protein [Gemmatimonadales bacterium]|nr:carboxypeptidase-like regulatory domain-containing protein [Gemmatimonadales bacterium]
MRVTPVVLIASAAWLASPIPGAPAVADRTQGHVEGTVRNEEGLAIPGAQVTGPSQLSATANGDGFYRLDNVGAGEVDLRAAAAGYRTSTVRVRVVDDSTTRADFALSREAVARSRGDPPVTGH